MKNKQVLGSIALFCAAFIWGVAFVFQRSGMDHIGPLTFMEIRCLLACVFLSVLLIIIKGPAKAFKFDKATIKGGLICGLMLVGANNLQQIGIVYTSAGKAGFITALYILLVPIANALFFKKKEGFKVWAAIALGAVGLYLLCINEDFSIGTGDIWIMCCAFFLAADILFADKYAADADPIQMCLIQFMVCSAANLALMFIFEDPTLSGIWDARTAIAFCGILSAGVGYTLQLVGQKHVKPVIASLIMSLESVFGVLGGWLLLNEHMTHRETLGCIIMFISIILVEIKPFEKRSK